MDDSERKKLLKPIKITAYLEPQIDDISNPTTWFKISAGGDTFSWPVEIGRHEEDNGSIDWARTLETFLPAVSTF
jgi:hypothetical protein